MRSAVTILDPLADQRHDVLIDAEDSTPMGEVLAELTSLVAADVPASGAAVLTLPRRDTARLRTPGRDVAPGSAPAAGAQPADPTAPAWFHLGRRIDPECPIAESGLHEGSLLVLHDPRLSVLEEPGGQVEVRVVSGPGAGSIHRLTAGVASIGSSPESVVPLPDDRLPSTCVTVEVGRDGQVTVTAPPGAQEQLTDRFPQEENRFSLDREPVDAGTPWPQGAQLQLGDSHLELEAVTAPDAAVEDSPEPGWVDYNRPPRLLPPPRQTSFRLPSPPSEQTKQGLPWLVMLLPLVLSLGFVLVTKRYYFLMMGLFSPVMMLSSWLQSRKQGKQSYRQQMAQYRDRLERIEQDVEQAVVDERLARRRDAPDPATALLIASGPRARLWERRRTDPDYLDVRIGTGDLESDVTVEDPQELEHRRLTVRTAYDVPVTINLRERGVVGLAGEDDQPRRLSTWAIAQLAVLQSPRDTWVYVLTDQEHADAWDWLRWLPHARPQQGQDTVVTIGTDAESCARRIAELTAVLAARRSAAGDRSRDTLSPDPDIVLVVDGARRLRSLPGVVALLKEGPALGLYSLCLDREERLLPEEASAVVLAGPHGVTVRQQQLTVVDRVTPDLVDGPWFHRMARALAPLRDISGGDNDSVLPSSCRLTEVMAIEPPSAEAVQARWAISPRSTEAIVGISLDGPFAIDLRRDGPHGLIAGTTGAGKSELLQTIVASLAVANRPDGMTFVLVDYKGGAAFKDCVDLPHTVGMVTDLDTHLVERALTSLGAELTRREHLLATAGAKDIEDYVDLATSRGGLPDMPRLLIVIDEFASMARELPDFVTGLVNIAQRGRSLGIHLILATQRPSGVVSPEIRANTNLRIALRVTDGSESTDVIDAPDAGLIAKSTPGRAYVRLGAQSLVPFQSGRVGGRRPGTVAVDAPPPWLTGLPLTALSKPTPTKPRQEASTDAEITDLTVLVQAVREANDTLGLPAQHSPWLPALTQDVQLDDLLAQLPARDDAAPSRVPLIPFALEDLPAQQERRPAVLDLETFSHLSVVGGPRSGRSQVLRTIAGAVAQQTSPADVHLYGLDCGNGALLPLVDLPHTGAVVQRTQTDRATRLLTRLTNELARRVELLSAGGYASITELREAVPEDERLPHLLVLLDRWEGFLGSVAELDGGTPNEQVQNLLREGASAGIHLVMTGDRQLVNARMGALVEDKIGLRLPDRTDYTMLALNPRKLPETIVEGRAFRSESAIEMQIALLGADTSGQGQAAQLRRIGAEASARYADLPRSARPFRVDVLPARIDFDEAWQLRESTEADPLWGLVGVGGDDLTAYGLDLARTASAIVAGPPRTGRSTLLLSIAQSVLRGGSELVVLAPRPSPLRELAGRPGVRAVLTATEIAEDELTPLVEEGDGPVVLLIDDGELLKDIDAGSYLKRLNRTGGDRQRAIVLGGDSAEVGSGFSGWQVDVKGRQGVLITPQGITDGELIGTRIPRSSIGAQPQPGRAMLHLGDGVLRTVQVPLVDPAEVGMPPREKAGDAD